MSSNEEWRFRDYFGGFVGGGGVLTIGLWMLLEPDKLAEGDYGPGRGGGFMRLLDAIWGVPGGVVIALLGLAVLLGTVLAVKSRD